jgi:hypothetical protein
MFCFLPHILTFKRFGILVLEFYCSIFGRVIFRLKYYEFFEGKLGTYCEEVNEKKKEAVFVMVIISTTVNIFLCNFGL